MPTKGISRERVVLANKTVVSDGDLQHITNPEKTHTWLFGAHWKHDSENFASRQSFELMAMEPLSWRLLARLAH